MAKNVSASAFAGVQACLKYAMILAYGAVVYIRWRLRSGKWWTMLVMSKSKIAPKNRITVVRLELNGAVVSKRLEEFVSLLQ